MEVTTLNEPPHNFLDASFGHATFGGEARDAGPGAALPFIDEVREHKGQHERERRQTGIDEHLVEPGELVTHLP